MRRRGGGVGLQVIPGGRPALGGGVAEGVGDGAGVGTLTPGVGVPVGDDEPAPHWASVNAANAQALASTSCLTFIGSS
jgi:hypothetical protein